MQIVKGWVDCAGKCRTWVILADGIRIAECTRLNEARLLVALLNGLQLAKAEVQA